MTDKIVKELVAERERIELALSELGYDPKGRSYSAPVTYDSTHTRSPLVEGSAALPVGTVMFLSRPPLGMPFKSQEECVEWMIKNDRAVVIMNVGTGSNE